MRLDVQAPAPAPRRDPDARILDSGLAIARRTRGWTFVHFPARAGAGTAIVAASRGEALVAWSSPVAIVGVGTACELRGHGATRFTDVIGGAAELEVGAIVGADGYVPRLFGGLAFAPGAADRAPWTGFGDAWFVLPRWMYSSDGQLVLAVDARGAAESARWHDELAALRIALATGHAAQPQPAMNRFDAGDLDLWRNAVRAITRAIDRRDCAKIVAARHAIVTLAGEVRAADLLAELDARHGECVRALVRPPGGTTLIAATPERLVRVDGTRVTCDALAGSCARHDGDAAELLASTKDRREHALVVDAIAAALRALGGDVELSDVPGIRVLRHVVHLHTPIAATLPVRRHVLEIVEALHPTPAVGGTPASIATAWIAAHEDARGWYASPVGWFDLEGNGELAVAIRSGVLDGQRAHLWAGAGIVAGSDPDRELAETDVKLRAILGALGVGT